MYGIKDAPVKKVAESNILLFEMADWRKYLIGMNSVLSVFAVWLANLRFAVSLVVSGARLWILAGHRSVPRFLSVLLQPRLVYVQSPTNQIYCEGSSPY